ncbi:MAG TPA: endopeptidase La [Pirellulales bacterium]|nr:endopeptidase La [Pirellulales bacterium]
MSSSPSTFTQSILPIKNTVLYPYLLMPLSVGRERSLAAVESAMSREDKTIVLIAQRDAQVEDPTFEDLYSVGTEAVIKRLERGEHGVQMIVQGTRRVELVEPGHATPFLEGRMQVLAEPTDSGPEIEALERAILDVAGRIQAMSQPESQAAVGQILSQFKDPLHQTYLLASMLSLDLEKEQQLLEANTRLEALRLMHEFLARESQIVELRQKIASQAQTEMSREQRQYLLRQQLRAIQQELGEGGGEQAEAAELRKRLDEAELPEEVRREASRELERLERLSPAAPDYQITRSYLDLILELPWHRQTDDNLDLARARTILDEDHFDLKEVKERIIEQLAVLKLNPGAKAPILCFVGPPGVGKTSLGQSIARALGRKFERMSLGGLHDESELRGHRRTYIGAMPGRILQAIRRADVRNPVMMLDEVDKIGHDFRGDPAAALLEILDPAQNFEFRDNYLNLPFDLSKTLFVATANTLDTIPRPLLDRMEILRLSGYSEQEKLEIAKRYLIRRQLSETGISAEQISIPDETLRVVIGRYTREAGVRQLERAIGQLARKVAVRFAEAGAGPVTVRPEDLPEMLGRERFVLEQARKDLPSGVATGLAWTETGGEVLYIEAVDLPGGRDLTLTGQLGEVMRESARAAQSYIWSQASQLGISEEILRGSGVHVHVPAGAIPKDGPSAGVAMATALASMYVRQPVRKDTAMTGEITLSGLVLPVGGIKEKLLAARRAGIHRVILPEQNAPDLREIPAEVAKEMEFILAARIEDVLSAAIPGLSERLANVAELRLYTQPSEDGNGRAGVVEQAARGSQQGR